MTRVDGDRAQWLARHILPLEPALRAWLKRRRVSGLDIDDIVQETYARLATLDDVSGIRNHRSYLFQAAQSIILSFVRRQRIVPIYAVDDAELHGMVGDEASPETQTVDRDALFRIARIIAGLPDQPRRVFILRRVEGMSQRETAQHLHLSESTVEKHMARALRLFMDAAGRGGEGESLSSGGYRPTRHGGANDPA